MKVAAAWACRGAGHGLDVGAQGKPRRGEKARPAKNLIVNLLVIENHEAILSIEATDGGK